MTLLEATGRYWRASRVLRGHSYGTPEVAETLLDGMWLHTDSQRLKMLAHLNAASRFETREPAKVISIA